MARKQRSRKVVFRPNSAMTFTTMDLALASFPETKKGDWLVADSTGEYNRFNFLLEQQAKGKIEGLYFHPAYILLPQTKVPANALLGKWVQSKIGYEADFSYFYCEKGIYIVEDFKAVYSDTVKNRAKGIAGKPIIDAAARLRHKLLVSKLIAQYGANQYFRIVTLPTAPLNEA